MRTHEWHFGLTGGTLWGDHMTRWLTKGSFEANGSLQLKRRHLENTCVHQSGTLVNNVNPEDTWGNQWMPEHTFLDQRTLQLPENSWADQRAHRDGFSWPERHLSGTGANEKSTCAEGEAYLSSSSAPVTFEACENEACLNKDWNKRKRKRCE